MKSLTRLAILGFIAVLTLTSCKAAGSDVTSYDLGDGATISLRTLVPSSVQSEDAVLLGFSITNDSASRISLAGRTLPYWFEVFDSEERLVWKHNRGQLDIATVYSLEPKETRRLDDPDSWDQTDTTAEQAQHGLLGASVPRGEYFVQAVLEIRLGDDASASADGYQVVRTPLSRLKLTP